jgi:UDP-GlcNAc:undecaprenyl-phosphate GlcNAc-1-phosphate transferase
VNFPFNYFAAAFLAAFASSWLALPVWRRWCLRTNLVDDPGHRKIHQSPVPLAGGFAVLTGLLLPLAGGWALLQLGVIKSSAAGALFHGLNRRGFELAVIALGAVAITLLGWADDRYELKALPKFTAQFLIALMVAAVCKRITLFIPGVWFSYAITILWILTVVNAFNFMDNMNGLCTGLGIISAFLFSLIAAGRGEYLVAVTGFLFCGALAGFLPWNFPNAKAFLGDAGSHLVGYLLAIMAILPHFYNKQNPHPLAVLAPLVVLAVPLVDLAQVSIFRISNGKPFWIGDTNHLSHRLNRAGLPRTQTVMLLWLISLIIGVLGAL